MKTSIQKILICSISYIMITTLVIMPFIVCQAGSLNSQYADPSAYQPCYRSFDPMFPLYP